MLGLACARTSKISEPLSAAIAAAVASALRIPGMIETTLAVHAAGARVAELSQQLGQLGACPP